MGDAARKLLRRKLTIPPRWDGAIRRERLLGALDAAMDAGAHIAVVAGSGFGKTTMLADWCRPRRCGWISLDPEDADPDTFLAYLIAALEVAVPGFRSGASDLFGRAPEPDGALTATMTLLADLEEQVEEPGVVVFDDYHAASSQSLDLLVDRLLKYLPDPLRLVISSRQTPEFQVGAWSSRRRLRLLDEPALAFDTEELRQLRPALTGAELAALRERTGGRPAALEMTPAGLDAYLEEQVLKPLPGGLRNFLLRAALFDEFDADICAEAQGEPLSTEWRKRLADERLAVPLEDGSLAVPRPLRDVLRRSFQSSLPRAERQAILSALASAHWNRGRQAEGVRLWIQAGDTESAACHLAGVAEDWLKAGRSETLSRAIGSLDDTALPPELRLAQGEILRRRGEFERAHERYGQALAGFDGRGDFRSGDLVRLREAQALASVGRAADARDRLEQARGGLPPNDPLQTDVQNLLGGLDLLEEWPRRAVPHFETSLLQARRQDDPYAVARAAHNLGVCYTKLGDFPRALEYYDTALSGGSDQPGAANARVLQMSAINRALVLVYLDRASEARVAAGDALESVRRYRLGREEGYALRTLGLALSRLGDFEAALGCYESAEHLARTQGDTLGLAYSLNFQADLHVSAGHPARALELSHQALDLAGGPDALERFPEIALVRCEAQLAAGCSAEALPALERLAAMARERGYGFLEQEAERLGGMSRGERMPARPTSSTHGNVPASPPDPPALTVRCFGRFHVERAGLPVGEEEWQSAKAKLVLIYLLHRPEGAAKGHLLELLYPEGTAGDSALHVTMMRLRRALEPGLEKGKPSRFIRWSEGRYSFNRQARVAVDTWALDATFRAWHALAADPAGEVRALRAALGLYTGELLPEFDTDWIAGMRLQYRDRILEACSRLVSLLDAYEPAAVLEVVWRALEIDPYAGEFHRELILRLVESGEPHRALEHYRLVERRYRETLGIEPPDDLADLMRDVLARFPGAHRI